MRDTFNTQLAAWGEERGFGPIELDAEGFAGLEDDGGMLLSLYLPAGAETLKALVDLAAAPDEDAGELYEMLLINNFGARPEEEGILALEAASGRVQLILHYALAEKTPEDLDAFLQRASYLGHSWRGRLAVSAVDEDEALLGLGADEENEAGTADGNPPEIPSGHLAV
jgi:hypothetical protein